MKTDNAKVKYIQENNTGKQYRNQQTRETYMTISSTEYVLEKRSSNASDKSSSSAGFAMLTLLMRRTTVSKNVSVRELKTEIII